MLQTEQSGKHNPGTTNHACFFKKINCLEREKLDEEICTRDNCSFLILPDLGLFVVVILFLCCLNVKIHIKYQGKLNTNWILLKVIGLVNFLRCVNFKSKQLSS